MIRAIATINTTRHITPPIIITTTHPLMGSAGVVVSVLVVGWPVIVSGVGFGESGVVSSVGVSVGGSVSVVVVG